MSDGPPARVHKFGSAGAGRVDDMNRLQKSFYIRHFVPRFVAGDPIDVEGQGGYAVVMLHELVARFDDDWEATVAGLELLMRAYPHSTAAYEAERCLRDIFLLQSRWEAAWGDSKYIHNVGMFLGLSQELGHPRLDPVAIIADAAHLTSAGIRELDAIVDNLGRDLDAFHDEHGISIIEDFWNRLAADLPVSEIVASIRGDVGPNLDDSDIGWSVERAREAGLFYAPVAFDDFPDLSRPIPLPRPWPRPQIFGLVWREFLRSLVRVAENNARVAAGIPRVGEGLVAEVRLLNELRAAFPNEVVHHQVRPPWLSPQSLDIVFANRELAVEYQGVQHSHPVEYFGGEKAFQAQQSRDANKRWLCEANGMHLIEVHPDYNLSDLIAVIESLLDRPTDS